MSYTSKFIRRREQAQRIMREKDIAAMQVTSRENYFYLTGDVRNVARLFLPQEGEPVVIVFAEEVDEARERTGIDRVWGWRNPSELMANFFNAMKEHDATGKKIGFCIHSNPGFLVHKFIKSNPKSTVVANEEVTMPLRFVKDDEEIEAMKRAAAAADKGMEAAYEAIGPGVTEIEVAREAEYAMRSADLMRFGTSTFVDSGPHSIYLHGGTSNRKIQKGDIVVIDLHPVVDMYCADEARTFVCGGPSTEQKDLIHLYHDIQSNVAAEVRPGWKLSMIADRMEQHFKDAGRPEWIKGPVHGVGLEFEEWPHPSHFPTHLGLPIGENWTLALGHSILPAPSIGGVKVEDTTLVTKSGCVNLTKYQTE